MKKFTANRTSKAILIMLAAWVISFDASAPAYAFGTVNQLGQNSEHGRITRRALTCQEDTLSGTCFESKTLNSLAGKKGSFGAVGAPDRGRGMLTSYAHCSAGDYYDTPDYPHSSAKAQATITECRDYMIENLRHAVIDAADLLNDDNEIRSRQASMTPGCVYKGSKHGRAKCNILAHMGRILHASQDFYSHSNWVGLPDQNRAISAENPPGLGHVGPAPWLNLRTEAPAFPNGLISGCFDNQSFLGEDTGCLYGEEGAHRVRHLNVNKDTGTIDPQIGEGTTERGALNDNFRRAVEAAISDTSDKWLTYSELLVETYGEERGNKMICILTHDSPKKSCK